MAWRPPVVTERDTATGDRAQGIKKPPAPGWGRAVSVSWYHPTLPRPGGQRPHPYGAPERHTIRRPGNGSRWTRNRVARRRLLTRHRLCRRSGRSFGVLFPGVPGPASQQPRFSAPLRPGTRPHRRRCDLCFLFHTLARNWALVNCLPPYLFRGADVRASDLVPGGWSTPVEATQPLGVACADREREWQGSTGIPDLSARCEGDRVRTRQCPGRSVAHPVHPS